MAIDFTFPPEVEDARQRMRAFVDEDVRPTEERLVSETAGRADWRAELDRLRARARELELWMPHMPREWGGVEYGPTALAAVSAEAAKSRFGSYVVNCYAPDEGNMHTLLHSGPTSRRTGT
ncbi:MAG TPA: acyl-CoA dehydrogenase family protein [Acidimicrobiales bacterium]|nr:acyl-CoA dehydrogenase family protein [Acidimicrobiales bacterium]